MIIPFFLLGAGMNQWDFADEAVRILLADPVMRPQSSYPDINANDAILERAIILAEKMTAKRKTFDFLVRVAIPELQPAFANFGNPRLALRAAAMANRSTKEYLLRHLMNLGWISWVLDDALPMLGRSLTTQEIYTLAQIATRKKVSHSFTEENDDDLKAMKRLAALLGRSKKSLAKHIVGMMRDRIRDLQSSLV